jgi:pimeloyl-ACP methyl ester carboxylesterase
VFDVSMEETRRTGNLGDRPLIVLTAGQLEEEIAAYPGVDEEAYKAARMMLQEELAALSTNSQLIVAERSGHIIQLYQPELVINAIRQVVEMCRN